MIQPLKKRSLFPQMAFALAILLIPITLIGIRVLIQNEINDGRELRETAKTTADRRDQLAQMLTLHLNLETGVRGFVLTSQPEFLEPYTRAIPQRDALFNKLRGGVETDNEQRLEELFALSERKLAHSALNVEDVRAGRVDEARARIARGDGRETMEAIRGLITEMDAREAERLTGLTRKDAGANRQIENSIDLLLAGLTFLLLMISFYLWRSAMARRNALVQVKALARRQSAMFDGAVDGMVWLDKQGNIIRLNPSISRMFGYSEEELLGRHNMFLMQDEFSHEQSMAWLRSVGESGAHGAGKRQEFTGLRADGSTFETEIAISLVPGDYENETCYVVAMRDISHRKRIERMKTEFVSTVSHELRTPLTSIGGSLGLLLGGAAGPLEQKSRHLVSIAHSNCERLIRLINDILDIEKIESGKMEFDIRRMQVAPLMKRVEEAMAGFASNHKVKLEVSIPPWPQCILGDPDRLDQLITNLISNAIKHSPEGQAVEVHCGQNGQFARIEVRDRGAGVPLSFRERIFGKFAMADASDNRTRSGTGLGLSIAREIARHHGGEIGFTDRQGGGTAFWVDLPLTQEQSLPASANKQDLPYVLHLDDDSDCLSVVAAAFEDQAQVLSAETLPEARKLLEENIFAAIIIDIDLGGENGLALVEEIRTRDRSVPILLFTAIDENAAVPGVDRVLIKSKASTGDLVDATGALIARGERRRA